MQGISPLFTSTQRMQQTSTRFGKFGADVVVNAVLNNTYRSNTSEGRQLAETWKVPDVGLRDYQLIKWLKSLDFQANKSSQSKVEVQAAAQKLCSKLSTVVAKMWAREVLEKSPFIYSETTNRFLALPA